MKKIFLSVLLLVFSLSFVACGGNTSTPTETTEAFLKAMKAQDASSLSGIYLGDNVSIDPISESGAEEGDALAQALAAKLYDFDYSLANEQIDGDKATVDVTITTYDLGTATTSALNDFMNQAFGLALSGATDEEIEALMLEGLTEKYSALSEKTYSKTVPLQLEKTNKGWQISELADTDPFIDAMSGGMISAFYGFIGSDESSE